MKHMKANPSNAVAALMLALAVIVPARVDAGIILVSGDSNIANALTGAFGGELVGNKTFFRNVLQGGTTVRVLQSTSIGSVGVSDTDIVTFYNTVPGVTSSLITGTVTPATLAGANLFVSAVPDDAFAASEVAALSGFVSGGGTIFFLGENSDPAFAVANASINSALASLGSRMSIVPELFGQGFNDATGSQIAADPFTAGVTSFRFAAPSRVSGGTNLLFGAEQQPFITYETVIPEPTTVALLAIGLAGLCFVGRLKSDKHTKV